MRYFHISDSFLLSLGMGTIAPLILIPYFPQLLSGSSSNIKTTYVMPAPEKTLTITSTAFTRNGNIPARFTCKGENVNPPLSIGSIPANAKSLAIIMDDPDAPNGTFVHWVTYNIPTDGVIKENKEPGTAGLNGRGREGYTGPCPPTGTHHYHFKVYALDVKPDLAKGADKKAVEQAITPHVMATGELIGLYKKTK